MRLWMLRGFSCLDNLWPYDSWIWCNYHHIIFWLFHCFSNSGSFFRLALQCSSSSRKGFRAVIIATMRVDEQIVTFELIRKFSKGQKIDRSSLMSSTFPIIATAVLGSKSPESFENWYYDSIDSQSRTTTCSNRNIQHLGIGKRLFIKRREQFR